MSTEPIYTYVKGQGWVVQAPRPVSPYDHLNEHCKNCNRLGGNHCGSAPHNCPAYDSDGYRWGYEDTVFEL